MTRSGGRAACLRAISSWMTLCVLTHADSAKFVTHTGPTARAYSPERIDGIVSSSGAPIPHRVDAPKVHICRAPGEQSGFTVRLRPFSSTFMYWPLNGARLHTT